MLFLILYKKLLLTQLFRAHFFELFGLDKWHDVPATLQRLETALAQVAPVAETA